ncbi:MAG TPA: hypothetical protein VMG10_13040 [Gemmataceae bacterium]|nr:hypothetical protein [Gemmataceae bacterium]
MRNLLIALGLLAYLAVVVVFALAREWSIVVPLIASGGLVENIAHSATKE